mmetsp:Transcript_41249/g.124725  ORF Transcript_41249/g.124725 Transcript_41249/m.124725 type:complete len:316 (+) Transcript_41249:1970-2917(+)
MSPYPNLSPKPPATRTKPHRPNSFLPTSSVSLNSFEPVSSKFCPAGTEGFQPSRGLTPLLDLSSKSLALEMYPINPPVGYVLSTVSRRAMKARFASASAVEEADHPENRWDWDAGSEHIFRARSRCEGVRRGRDASRPGGRDGDSDADESAACGGSGATSAFAGAAAFFSAVAASFFDLAASFLAFAASFLAFAAASILAFAATASFFASAAAASFFAFSAFSASFLALASAAFFAISSTAAAATAAALLSPLSAALSGDGGSACFLSAPFPTFFVSLVTAHTRHRLRFGFFFNWDFAKADLGTSFAQSQHLGMV